MKKTITFIIGSALLAANFGTSAFAQSRSFDSSSSTTPPSDTTIGMTTGLPSGSRTNRPSAAPVGGEAGNSANSMNGSNSAAGSDDANVSSEGRTSGGGSSGGGGGGGGSGSGN